MDGSNGSNGYAHTSLRMDKRTAELKGSPLRDLYKQLHKAKLAPHMVGCDLDFVIVEKDPDCIVAFKDVKRYGEKVTFSEVIAYNQLLRLAPLYLLYAENEEALEVGKFIVHRYLGGNRRPNPPTIQTEIYARLDNWNDYQRWEQELRNATKQSRPQRAAP